MGRGLTTVAVPWKPGSLITVSPVITLKKLSTWSTGASRKSIVIRDAGFAFGSEVSRDRGGALVFGPAVAPGTGPAGAPAAGVPPGVGTPPDLTAGGAAAAGEVPDGATA